jgi:hypothetical protein
MLKELVIVFDVAHIALGIGVRVQACKRWRENRVVDRIVRKGGDTFNAIAMS